MYVFDQQLMVSELQHCCQTRGIVLSGDDWCSSSGGCLTQAFALFLAPNTETQPLLTWRKAQETVPWNIILLLGGGFAMAKGCEVRPTADAMWHHPAQQGWVLSGCHLVFSFGFGKLASMESSHSKDTFLNSKWQQYTADNWGGYNSLQAACCETPWGQVLGEDQFPCRGAGGWLLFLLSPSAGVWLVCVDRRPSASLGGCATTRGCHPHHVCHRLVHRVCQQHCHYYHLSACLGRAGKVISWQDQFILCPLLALPLGWAGFCWVCAGTGTGQFSCSWALQNPWEQQAL